MSFGGNEYLYLSIYLSIYIIIIIIIIVVVLKSNVCECLRVSIAVKRHPD